MGKDPLIYIAGPLRPNEKQINEIENSGLCFADKKFLKQKIIDINISHARAIAREISLMGACPVTPHLLTVGIEHTAEEKIWLFRVVELMKRCDAVYFMNGWEWSEGSCVEYQNIDKSKILRGFAELGTFIEEFKQKESNNV